MAQASAERRNSQPRRLPAPNISPLAHQDPSDILISPKKSASREYKIQKYHIRKLLERDQRLFCNPNVLVALHERDRAKRCGEEFMRKERKLNGERLTFLLANGDVKKSAVEVETLLTRFRLPFPANFIKPKTRPVDHSQVFSLQDALLHFNSKPLNRPCPEYSIEQFRLFYDRNKYNRD